MREVVVTTARTATGDSGPLTVGPDAIGETLNLAVNVTAASGTTPTLDLSIEWSTDSGRTWFAADPADEFTEITAVTKAVKAFTAKAPHYRIVWTIGGTTPSFTFSVSEHV